jgi:hypothetical protein
MTIAIDNVISSIDFETKTSRASGKPFKIWSVTLDNGTVLKMGFNKPVYEVGQRIMGTATTNKFGDVEFNPGGVAPKGATTATAARSVSAPAASGGRSFPVGKTSPEMSIIRQNSLTNANATMRALLTDRSVEAMGFTDADGALDMDAVKAWVLDLAYHYTEFSSGQREVKMVEAMANDE